MTAQDALRHQAGITRAVVGMNLDGLTHEESLLRPEPAGNCANWVLGHLVQVHDEMLALLGAGRVRPEGAFARYTRGSAPLTDAAEATPLDELRSAWEEACERADGALAAVPDGRLGEPAGGSPSGDPDETIGSLLATILFHQAYHAGQLGVLRRLAGKPGAIP